MIVTAIVTLMIKGYGEIGGECICDCCIDDIISSVDEYPTWNKPVSDGEDFLHCLLGSEIKPDHHQKQIK